MIVTIVTIRHSQTVNVGSFQFVKAEVEMTAELSGNDTPEEATEELNQLVLAELNRVLTVAVEGVK